MRADQIQTRNIVAFSGCFLLSILYFYICSDDLSLLRTSLLFGSLLAIPWVMYGCLSIASCNRTALLPAILLLVTMAFPSPLFAESITPYVAVGSLLISFLLAYSLLIILVSAIEGVKGETLKVSTLQ